MQPLLQNARRLERLGSVPLYALLTVAAACSQPSPAPPVAAGAAPPSTTIESEAPGGPNSVAGSAEPSPEAQAEASTNLEATDGMSESASALPLCDQASNGRPYCLQGAFTDPDGDGWGWEQERSCIVPNASADPNPNSCRIEVMQAGGGSSPARIVHNGQELYLSGFNIAWFNFAGDVGAGLDEARLRQALTDLRALGGNTLRWWIHTDGSTTPEWGGEAGQRLVTGPGGSFIADFQRALDIASEFGAYLVPSLWSFDMLRSNPSRNPPNADNYRLLTDDAVLQSYLDNVLVPLVSTFAGHPALVAWELFNEPENMTESWFSQEAAFYGGGVPTIAQLQRTQAKMAATIHRTASANGLTALVTTGSKSMGKYTSDVAGGTNLYRDDRLIAAADGDAQATFDFYEPHYYNNEGDGGRWSPFHHPASYWGVDKPIVIGEFYVQEPLDVLGEPIEGSAMCQRLVDQGYAGGWPWQWNEYLQPIQACVGAVTLP